ncbi:MAG: hypothetical protein IKJ43_04785 [Bacilli bacterium]|nr:hypothetical protein [Bacilli bacterium]
MNKTYYAVEKNNKLIIQGYINYESISGFDIKPQNKVPYDGIEVGHLKLVEPHLIEKVLKRKIKRKLNTYLNFLLTVVDDDDDDSEALELVIDDLERYKLLIINKYALFLDKRYIASLLKKITFVERELKNKIRELTISEEIQIGRKR